MFKPARAAVIMVIAAVLAPLILAAGKTGALASVFAMAATFVPLISQLSVPEAPPVNNLGRVSNSVTMRVTSLASAGGKVYLGTNNQGHLYSYDVISGTVDLGQGEAGGQIIRALTVGSDGKIYGGTDNNAFLFGYSPVTGQKVTPSPGTVVGGENDVFALISAADGKLYGGTGPNAHLFRYTPISDTVPVDLGIPVPGQTNIVGLGQTNNGLIFGATEPITPTEFGKLFWYSPVTTTVIGVTSLGKTPTSLAVYGQNVYIGTSDGELLLYDGTGSLSNLGKPVEDSSRILCLTVDGDGNLFGGTYPSGKAFRYTPSTGFMVYGNPVESETWIYSLVASGTDLYLGTGSEGYLFKTGTQPLPTPTATPTATLTPTETPVPVATAVPVSTSTPVPLSTPGSTPVPDEFPYKTYVPWALKDGTIY